MTEEERARARVKIEMFLTFGIALTAMLLGGAIAVAIMHC